MSTDTTEAVQYAVARNESLLTEPTSNLGAANADLGRLSDAMRVAGLEPDVRVVEFDVTVTTKIGRPRAVRVPASATDEAAAEGDRFVWGSEGDKTASE
jgi:hypothetical protein